MKVSLHLSVIALVGVATMQAAQAQDHPGARFSFAPNVWKSESARIPKGYGNYEPQHNVQNGSVPTKNVLGLDPVMLSKPAPVAPVVTTAMTPTLTIPKASASFNPAFGKPLMAQPLVAHLPSVVPAQAMARTAPPVKPAAAAPAHTVAHLSHGTGLSGRMLRPAIHNVEPTMATPQVASYGDKFYTPSSNVPSTVSASLNASGKVSGKILTTVHHH